MPRKALKTCIMPGCPNLFSGDGNYCPEHARKKNSMYNRYERTPEEKKRYGHRWRQIRAKFLLANPTCVMCRRDGRFTEATEVHHIIPLSRGGTHDVSNLMALCKSCHSRITVEMEKNFKG